jgi:hypothetical protein
MESCKISLVSRMAAISWVRARSMTTSGSSGERLVEETENSSTGAESRRRYYRLTKLGRGVLATEIARLEKAICEAKLHLGFQRSAM